MDERHNRFVRQENLVPREVLGGLDITVVGIGAIGRQVALQLAALGARKLRLVDFDIVELTNVTTQGYLAAEIGLAKVEAAAGSIRQIDPTIEMELVQGRFGPRTTVRDALFCCVDSITARAAIWRATANRCRFWCDVRMLGEVIRVLTVADRQGRQHFPTTLFAQAEAQSGACTSRGVIYTAAIAAGLMIHQFTRWLRQLPVDVDLSLNLLASDLVAA